MFNSPKTSGFHRGTDVHDSGIGGIWNDGMCWNAPLLAIEHQINIKEILSIVISIFPCLKQSKKRPLVLEIHCDSTAAVAWTYKNLFTDPLSRFLSLTID